MAQSQADQARPFEFTDGRPRPNDFAKTIDGFDEIAIEARFKKHWTDLAGTTTVRAFAFVRARRLGLSDGDAYQVAMKMPLGALDGLFTTEESDDDSEGKALGQ